MVGKVAELVRELERYKSSSWQRLVEEPESETIKPRRIFASCASWGDNELERTISKAAVVEAAVKSCGQKVKGACVGATPRTGGRQM